MRTMRRVLLGIAAAGLASSAAGCAAIVDRMVGGAAMAAGYESVPGAEYNDGPRVVGRLGLFGGSDGADCGLSAKRVWRPDPTVAIPGALSGSGSGSGVGPAGSGVDLAVPGGDVVVPAVGVRASPLHALMQPLAAARFPGDGMAWWLDYESCPSYPETPR